MIEIMIAEDQQLIRESLKIIIDSQPEYTVVAALENGEQVLQALKQQRADIILMDIRMPVMDGLESARRIRTSGRPDARRIPIIALTANAFDEDTRKSLASGMNGHLSKPIQVDQMLEILGKCMGLKK